MENAYLCRLHMFEIQQVMAVCVSETILIFLCGCLCVCLGIVFVQVSVCVCTFLYLMRIATAIQHWLKIPFRGRTINHYKGVFALEFI